mmetsp:Transcript_19645/g.66847  ORF Transcript_19645/g.66847 Transcript_19645/m.66847 type:complete len:341 (+) Transcript_19645:1762-2784(+)
MSSCGLPILVSAAVASLPHTRVSSCSAFFASGDSVAGHSTSIFCRASADSRRAKRSDSIVPSGSRTTSSGSATAALSTERRGPTAALMSMPLFDSCSCFVSTILFIALITLLLVRNFSPASRASLTAISRLATRLRSRSASAVAALSSASELSFCGMVTLDAFSTSALTALVTYDSSARLSSSIVLKSDGNDLGRAPASLSFWMADFAAAASAAEIHWRGFPLRASGPSSMPIALKTARNFRLMAPSRAQRSCHSVYLSSAGFAGVPSSASMAVFTAGRAAISRVSLSCLALTSSPVIPAAFSTFSTTCLTMVDTSAVPFFKTITAAWSSGRSRRSTTAL